MDFPPCERCMCVTWKVQFVVMDPQKKFFTAHIFTVSACSRLINVANLQYTLKVCRFFTFAVKF